MNQNVLVWKTASRDSTRAHYGKQRRELPRGNQNLPNAKIPVPAVRRATYGNPTI